MKKKSNRLKRRLVVTRRKIKRLTPKKVKQWFKNNIKQHPFILSILFFIWIDFVVRKSIFTKWNAMSLSLFHCAILIVWLIFVVISNLLKDKERVKWYLRKRFVFSMLLFLAPVGFILLWSGSKFKRITKIVLTIVFGLLFIGSNIYYSRRYEKVLKKTSFEMIVEMVTKPKSKIFLKEASSDILNDLNFIKIPRRSKAKLAISEIASRCSPSVVAIKTKDREGKEIGAGSGFVISKNGLIATNFHVLESAYEAEVKVGDEIFSDVFLVKGFPDLDIAILKINSDNLSALPIGNSDSIVNGQFIIVLGNPLGLERSVSNGLISAIRSKGNTKLIQITAPVSPGSSGGPVINEYGEVIGITTIASFFMVQNLNFAIPVNYLEQIIKEK